ncbi:MAG: hypothetical protein EP343_06125 [Deltaproteobacteria bacterium]|nr:MAG: hypothetical protein EP343_06125 [Deltaproteobacteria bacterium]
MGLQERKGSQKRAQPLMHPKPSRYLQGHGKVVLSVAFSEDGKTLLSASADQTLRLWDVQTGAMKRILKGHEGTVRSARFFLNDQAIVSGSADKTARVWFCW